MAAVAEADRPREKLARVGAESLGDNELLALVLGSGTRSRGALIVADDVLREAGGVRGLSRIGADELCRVSGVGLSKASRVVAAVELGRRTLMSPSPRRRRLITTDDLVAHLLPRYSGFRDERFGVLLLDGKQRLMRTVILAQGAHEYSIAVPREAFRVAAMASASGVVLFHNHPSGDPAPSYEDRMTTTRLRAGGAVLGIDVIDHIILGDKRIFSFREEERA